MSTIADSDVTLIRPKYRRDGNVKWGRLPFAILFSSAVAIGMALVLVWMFKQGWYFLVIVPLAASLPVAAACYLAVMWAHCRNVGAAVLIGLISGLVLYPGWFHFHMVSLVGGQVVHRVDLLPRFILFRIRNDAAGEIGKPVKQPNVVSNSVFFGAEFLMVMAITVAAATTRTKRVYCSHCGEWGRHKIQNAATGSASLINRLLTDGLLVQLPEIPQIPLDLNKPSASITVEACPGAGRSNSCCAFLTLKENPGTKNKGSSSLTLLNQVAITREELGYLASRVSGLVSLAPAGFVPEVAVASAAIPLARQVAKGPSQLARTELASETDVEEVYSARSTAMLVVLSFVPVISFVAGCVLLFLAWKMWPAAQPARVWPALGCLVIGVVGVVFGAVVCWTNVDYFNTQRKFNWVRDRILRRRDSWVSPNDLNARFVEIVPRETWAHQLSRNPADGGFVLVDEQRQELLFEGLKERYRIPGSAILSCEVINISPDAGNFSFFATVVKARTAPRQPAAETETDSVWEISFMVRPVRFEKYSGKTRERAHNALRDDIQRIVTMV